MGGRRWGWRWRSMRRLRRMRGARVCSGDGRVVHVGGGKVLGDGAEVELVGVELLVERGALGDGDGEAHLVERSLNLNCGGEADVAELPVVAVKGLGCDHAIGVVDVLLVGQQVDAADVNDTQGTSSVAVGLGEELE